MKLAPALAAALVALAAGPARPAPVEDRLAEAVEGAVRARADLPPDATVRVGDVRPSDPALLARARGVRAVELPRGERGTGVVTARVTLDVPGEADAWTWVRARVDARAPVLVAARDVPRGAVLAPADLRLEPRPLRGGEARAAADAVGLAPRRALRAGDTVEAAWLEAPALVTRGATVEAIVRSGALTVRARAEALDGGAAGDTVRVRLGDGRHVAQGTVIGPGRVEVMP